MIKPTYRVLVLTDHSKHSKENSLYALLQAMRSSDRCQSIDVASRGLAKNHAFFTEHKSDALYAAPVSTDFTFSPSGKHFIHQLRLVDIINFDLIFLRLPRPVTDSFLEWLPQIFPTQVMVNHPKGILATSTKAFLLQFSDLCPNMQLCKKLEDVQNFVNEEGSVILKPLQEYGGKGILKVTTTSVDDGQTIHPWKKFSPVLKKQLTENHMLGMRFLKNVDQGDKRILVVNGQILAASLRLPAEGSWLCNVAQGGRSIKAITTPQEEHIVKRITPKLRQAGVLIYGVDTLMDDDGIRVLSEINTLSIGGFPQAEAQSGLPIIPQTIEQIFTYADQYKY